jgi:hypothetical protein
MKQPQHSTLTDHKTTSADVFRWTQELFRLHARLAPRFARPEPHRRVLRYLQGILSDTARKNGWQLAEYEGCARPDGMQRLHAPAVWVVLTQGNGSCPKNTEGEARWEGQSHGKQCRNCSAMNARCAIRGQSQQVSGPGREGIVQVSEITFDQFQQALEDLFGDLDGPSHSLGRQDPFQTRAIELVNAAGHRIFATEQHGGDLGHTVMLARKQDDMAAADHSDMGRVVIEPTDPFLFLGGQGTHIQFTWSAHDLFLAYGWDDAFHFTRFPSVVSPLYLEGSAHYQVLPSIVCQGAISL